LFGFVQKKEPGFSPALFAKNHSSIRPSLERVEIPVDQLWAILDFHDPLMLDALGVAVKVASVDASLVHGVNFLSHRVDSNGLAIAIPERCSVRVKAGVAH
jgi:hypothetical protein